MSLNAPDMKFTKNTFLNDETDVFYIHQKISPLPADKVNKHACPSTQKHEQKNKKQKKSKLRRKTLPESEKCDVGTSFTRNKNKIT
ncbi:hypothetical protein IH270_001757 [Escherichia coli]|nr:hypothetical protein [Escherichia coli]